MDSHEQDKPTQSEINGITASAGTSAGLRIAEHIEQFFVYAHLPAPLQEVSRPFAELADRITRTIPRNPERTVALRKLLEAKDAAVRAVLAH